MNTNEVPVFDESIGGALIDAARINVMAALQAFPARIVLPGDSAQPSLPDCLAEALEWLNAARSLSLEETPPPTSLHVVGFGS